MDRKTVLLQVLRELKSMFPQIPKDDLKKIIASSVRPQEGNLVPAPLLQICSDHILTSKDTPQEEDLDKNDLNLLNGSQDPADHEAVMKRKHDTTGQNGGVKAKVVSPSVQAKSKESHLKESSSETSSEDEIEVHVPVITIVKEVMSVFPEADKWWIIKQCKDMKQKYQDTTIAERICNYMYENTYPQTGDDNSGRALMKKKSSKRLHSKTSKASPKEETEDTHRVIADIPVPCKVSKTEDCPKAVVSEVSLQSAPNLKFQFTNRNDERMSEPQPGTSTDDLHCRQDLVPKTNGHEINMDCERCQEKCNIELTAPCFEGHIICKNCVEKCVKPILSGAKQAEITCPLENCAQPIPMAHAKRALPQILVDIIEEKIAEQNLEKLKSSIEGLFKCPHCSFVAYMEPEVKCFTCESDECKKETCRYCEKEWIDSDLHLSCNKHTAKCVSNEITLPNHWQPMDPNHPGYIKVKLEPKSEEYQKVSDQFHMVEYQKQQQQLNPQNLAGQLMFGARLGNGAEYPGHGIQIRSIHRVQNPKLWKIYSLKRQLMLQENGEERLNEFQLFHGTGPNVVNAICAENFDFRLSGAHGTAMGHGVYFAVNSGVAVNYSIRAATGCKCGKCSDKKLTKKQSLYMFLTDVLVGEWTKSTPTDRRPPKNKATGRLYNSTMGHLNADKRDFYKCYVTFDAMQQYPHYLIEFGFTSAKLKGDKAMNVAQFVTTVAAVTSMTAMTAMTTMTTMGLPTATLIPTVQPASTTPKALQTKSPAPAAAAKGRRKSGRKKPLPKAADPNNNKNSNT